MPLSEGLLTLLSPESAAVWVLGPPGVSGGVESATFRIHQAPGAGALQILRWIAASAFAGLCYVRAADRVWRRRLPAVVLGSVVLASLVCLAQTAAGSEAILGLYVPRAGFAAFWRAPLINPNHWSAYLSVGVLIGLGMAMRAEGVRLRGWSLLCAFGALLLILQVCFSSSRGGVLGLGAGAAVFVLLVFKAHGAGGARRPRGLRPVAGLLALLLIGVALWGAMLRTESRLDPYSGEEFGGLREESRLELLPFVREVIADHRLTGVGRGALYDVFPRYRDMEGDVLSAWMEVLPVDLVLDFGWPLGALLNILCCGMLVLALREGRRGPTRAGAAAALVALAVHELGDFSTEGGAVLFVAVALSTLVLSTRDRTPGRASQTELPSLADGGDGARRSWAAVLAVCLLALPLAIGAAKHADVSRCLVRMAEANRGGASWAGLAEEEWAYHPSSFPLALGVAVTAQREGDALTALAWLNRAQLLAPYHPGPHLRTARLLRRLGADGQALVEYRLAMAGDWRGRARDIFKEVARAYPAEEALRGLVPEGRPEAIAQFAMWLRELEDPRTASFGMDALEQLSESPATLMAGIYARIDRTEYPEARALIEKGWKAEGLDPSIRLRLAVSMGWSGDPKRSLAMLRGMASGLQRDWPSFWFSLGRAEARAGNAPAARRALRRVGWTAPSHWRAKALRVEADLADADGRGDEAERLRGRAQSLDGSASSIGGGG
jgi:Flp pilus assembly protein TadD